MTSYAVIQRKPVVKRRFLSIYGWIMKIELTNKNVKLLGRTMLFDDTLLLSLSGSGIEFEYSGKGFNITFIGGEAAELKNNDENYAHMAIYVDGIKSKDFLLDQK